jgi:hypothetical protein
MTTLQESLRNRADYLDRNDEDGGLLRRAADKLDAVDALVKQWRAEALQVAEVLPSASIGTQYGVKVTLQECADELAATLAQESNEVKR